MATMSNEEALAHMQERYPDNPLWATPVPTTTDAAAPADATATEPQRGSPGFKAGSWPLGLSALGGAYAGNKIAGKMTPYQFPAEVDVAKAQEELDKAIQKWKAGSMEFGSKSEALRGNLQGMQELQSRDQAALNEARGAYYTAKGASSPEVQSVVSGKAPAVATETPTGGLMPTPEQHARQVQGTGGAQPEELPTGRSRVNAWRSTESEIKEAKDAAARNLQQMQARGLVPQGGVSLQFSGVTAASPGGVLVPGQVGKEFEVQEAAKAAKTAAQNAVEAEKLARLKDEYALAKSGLGKTETKLGTTQAGLMAHEGSRFSQLSPYASPVEAAQKALTTARQVPVAAPLTRIMAKVPGALTGAGAALSGAEAYERAQQGDTFGATVAGMGAGAEALGVLPHPGAKAIAVAGGLSSAAILALYDMYGPEVLQWLEQKGLYKAPSVMDKPVR